MNDGVMKLLDMLEDLLDESSSLPFSKKVAINKDEFHDIVTDVRLKLPAEIKQSKWVMDERNKILIEAQKEAEEIIKGADSQVEKRIEENEITKKAYERAEDIIEDAKKTARDMRIGSFEYADQILEYIENKSRRTLEIIHSECSDLEKNIEDTLSTIQNNRKELNVGENRNKKNKD